MSIFVKEKPPLVNVVTDIQRKHRQEYDAAIDDALLESFDHLTKALNRFSSVIHDRELLDQFADGINKAQEILAQLGAAD